MIAWMLLTVVVLVVSFVLLSPLESLTWWTRRGEREVRETFALVRPGQTVAPSAAHYVVYLSGVGTVGGELSRRERAWIDRLRERVPDVRVVDDVFPYAVNNRGLLQRTTAWLWSTLDGWRRGRWPLLLPLLIELRNIAQVLVSADPRYGPTFNIGLAQEIWRSLQRQGYAPGSGVRVTLIGFSGGAQMALGAGWFLDRLGVPVALVSVGGIFGDDPGLDRMGHVWHLVGSRDRLRHLGTVAFPGRWPTAPLSPYGRARRDGRLTEHVVGTMHHAGAAGYLGRRHFGPDGRSNAETTLDAVVALLEGHPPLPSAASGPQ